MGNKPVNFVSFFDAMRFVNWLHNGQPSGAQDDRRTCSRPRAQANPHPAGRDQSDAAVTARKQHARRRD
ncbi:MAG: hypothetical protein ACYTHJ_11290, partial [Planctomycetota bacterium]